MRYSVSGRAPSLITTALALFLALAVQLLSAANTETGSGHAERHVASAVRAG